MPRFVDRYRSGYRPPHRPGPDIIVMPASDAAAPAPERSTEARPSGAGAWPREMPVSFSCLEKGTSLSGSLAYHGPGRIDGDVEGEVSAADMLVIGQTAVIAARVDGDWIIVAGRVRGDITARSRLELQAGAEVVGNIVTPMLVVEPGAFFDGHCSMRVTGAGEAREEQSQGA